MGVKIGCIFALSETQTQTNTTMKAQLKAIYEQGITEAQESIERAIAARAARAITDEVYYARIEKWDGAIHEYQTKLQELGA